MKQVKNISVTELGDCVEDGLISQEVMRKLLDHIHTGRKDVRLSVTASRRAEVVRAVAFYKEHTTK